MDQEITCYNENARINSAAVWGSLSYCLKDEDGCTSAINVEIAMQDRGVTIADLPNLAREKADALIKTIAAAIEAGTVVNKTD